LEELRLLDDEGDEDDDDFISEEGEDYGVESVEDLGFPPLDQYEVSTSHLTYNGTTLRKRKTTALKTSRVTRFNKFFGLCLYQNPQSSIC
jgi:hypothetical protein